MKLLITLILIVCLPLMGSFTKQELSDEIIQVEIVKAIEDFNAGIYDANGSEAYKRAMVEIEQSGVKSNTAEGIAIGVFGTLFLSSASSASSAISHEEAVNNCIYRCRRWTNVDYYTCRSDCRYDPNSY